MIELLVTLSILAIVTAIVAPNLSNISDSYLGNKLKLEARSLTAALQGFEGTGGHPIIIHYTNGKSGDDLNKAVLGVLKGTAGAGENGGRDYMKIIAPGQILGPTIRYIPVQASAGPEWKLTYNHADREFVAVKTAAAGFKLSDRSGEEIKPLHLDTNVITGFAFRSETNWIWDYEATGPNPGGNPSNPPGPGAKNFVLTVEVLPAGGGTATPSSGAYPENSVIALKAFPSSGYYFVEWRVDASGSDPESSVTMTSDKTVRAVFATILPPVIGVKDPGTEGSTGTLDLPPSNPPGTEYEYRIRTSDDGGATFSEWTPWKDYTPGMVFDIFPQARGIVAPPPPQFLAGGTLTEQTAPIDTPLYFQWNTSWAVRLNPTSPPNSELEPVSGDFIPAQTKSNAFVDKNVVTGEWRTSLSVNLVTEIQARATYNGVTVYAVPRVETAVIVRYSDNAAYSYGLKLVPPTITSNMTNEQWTWLNQNNPPNTQMDYYQNENDTAIKNTTQVSVTEAMDFGDFQNEKTDLGNPTIIPANGQVAEGTPFTVTHATGVNAEAVFEIQRNQPGSPTSPTGPPGTILFGTPQANVVSGKVRSKYIETNVDAETKARARVSFRGLRAPETGWVEAQEKIKKDVTHYSDWVEYNYTPLADDGDDEDPPLPPEPGPPADPGLDPNVNG